MLFRSWKKKKTRKNDTRGGAEPQDQLVRKCGRMKANLLFLFFLFRDIIHVHVIFFSLIIKGCAHFLDGLVLGTALPFRIRVSTHFVNLFPIGLCEESFPISIERWVDPSGGGVCLRTGGINLSPFGFSDVFLPIVMKWRDDDCKICATSCKCKQGKDQHLGDIYSRTHGFCRALVSHEIVETKVIKLGEGDAMAL